jgi:putative nucleotidyltransferase with HDIG domain
MTTVTTDEATATVLELLPEIGGIGDAELRSAVTRIWVNAWQSSVWDELAHVPKSPELPTKRTLITHTRAVTRIAGHMVDVESEMHGVTISKDETLAAALLHDVCKLHEFERDTGDDDAGEGGGSGDNAGGRNGGRPGARFSRIGTIYQHGFLGAHWMAREGLSEDMIHAVIAHTPLSAVVPKTQEAVIVHYADFVDSDVQLLDAGRTLFCKRRK